MRIQYAYDEYQTPTRASSMLLTVDARTKEAHPNEVENTLDSILIQEGR